jgi:hypothetical protein
MVAQSHGVSRELDAGRPFEREALLEVPLISFPFDGKEALERGSGDDTAIARATWSASRISHQTRTLSRHRTA